jgi:hypothetical protein
MRMESIQELQEFINRISDGKTVSITIIQKQGKANVAVEGRGWFYQSTAPTIREGLTTIEKRAPGYKEQFVQHQQETAA